MSFNITNTLKDIENKDIEIQRSGLESFVKHLKIEESSYDVIAEKLASVTGDLIVEKQLCSLGCLDFIIQTTTDHKKLMKTKMVPLLTKYIEEERAAPNIIKFCQVITRVCSSPEGKSEAFQSKTYRAMVPLMKHDDLKVRGAATSCISILTKNVRCKLVIFKEFPTLIQDLVDAITSCEDDAFMLSLIKCLVIFAESPKERFQLNNMKIQLPTIYDENTESDIFKYFNIFMNIKDLE